METQDFFYRHISLVFDNYEDHYWELQDLVKKYKAGKIVSLSNAISDLYYDAIGKALQGNSALGHRLIEELCFGIPSHIFDELADKYAPLEEEVNA